MITRIGSGLVLLVLFALVLANGNREHLCGQLAGLALYALFAINEFVLVA